MIKEAPKQIDTAVREFTTQNAEALGPGLYEVTSDKAVVVGIEVKKAEKITTGLDGELLPENRQATEQWVSVSVRPRGNVERIFSKLIKQFQPEGIKKLDIFAKFFKAVELDISTFNMTFVLLNLEDGKQKITVKPYLRVWEGHEGKGIGSTMLSHFEDITVTTAKLLGHSGIEMELVFEDNSDGKWSERNMVKAGLQGYRKSETYTSAKGGACYYKTVIVP